MWKGLSQFQPWPFSEWLKSVFQFLWRKKCFLMRWGKLEIFDLKLVFDLQKRKFDHHQWTDEPPYFVSTNKFFPPLWAKKTQMLSLRMKKKTNKGCKGCETLHQAVQSFINLLFPNSYIFLLFPSFILLSAKVITDRSHNQSTKTSIIVSVSLTPLVPYFCLFYLSIFYTMYQTWGDCPDSGIRNQDSTKKSVDFWAHMYF